MVRKIVGGMTEPEIIEGGYYLRLPISTTNAVLLFRKFILIIIL